MEKFPSLKIFYTHAVTGVTDNYQVWPSDKVFLSDLGARTHTGFNAFGRTSCESVTEEIRVSRGSIDVLIQITFLRTVLNVCQ